MVSKKSLIIYIISILVFAIFFSYSLVFAIPVGNKNYTFYSASNNIFLDSLKLNSNQIITDKYFSNYKITGDCSVFGKLIGKKDNYSVFEIKVLNNSCDKKNIEVKFDLDGSVIKKQFNLITSYELYSNLLDRDSLSIKKSIKDLEKIISLNQQSKDLKLDRKNEEIIYLKNFLQEIIDKRNNKYKIPVLGASLPSKRHKIPNTGRPYRKDYTDGIHHGWDFDAKKGDSVIALDDGIIVRVINNFIFSDLGKINKSKNIGDIEKVKNLDILRGNQIWVKTMKGDVAFYSHLNEVFSDIKVGTVVSRGQPLGTIGSTGVPDKDYNDFHLHIPIHKNPYLKAKIGKYTEIDYMMWDWYFKGKSLDYIMENQKNIFEK